MYLALASICDLCCNMKSYATYLQNSETQPLVYGEVTLQNPLRQRLRGEVPKPGIVAKTVLAGFCGTDWELLKMGRAGQLHQKFPQGDSYLVNGHEGVVWVPDENRFAIVLIRGGNSWDPTRFTEEESYFEYGCDGAHGLFSDQNYYHPDMLLHLPKQYGTQARLPLTVAKKLVFCDPYACAIFQRERMEDIGEAHNFRVEMAKRGCDAQTARAHARRELFNRVVIFGLGTTGLFIGDQIRRSYPQAQIVFAGRSAEDSEKVRFAKKTVRAQYVCTEGLSETQTAEALREALGGRATVFVGASGTQAEHNIAFAQGVLGCNGIYNSFSLGPQVAFASMPFGFQNQLIVASINFRQAHMQQAIEILCESNFDTLVSIIDKTDFIRDPQTAYAQRIFSKGAPLKTAVVWNADYVEGDA